MYVPIENEVFHVHTKRCGHAGNYEDREYVEIAIALGATRIVFTDHVPFPGNPFGNRMPYEQLPEYIGAINQLREEYKGRIDNASKEVGVSTKCIRDAATGKQKHAGGFVWKYKEA